MAESNGVGAATCSICLELLKRPVTLHCGHSYCMDCVNGYWDQEDHKGVYSCPQCRHIFSPRPLLNKSTVLADLMGKMSGAGEPPPPPVKSDPSARDVECDFCTSGKLKAVKTCLVCLASYCATHLRPHYESAAFKRHKLVDVSTPIEDRICPKHDKLLEVYCRTDGKCVCLLCVMDEHRGHDTVSAAAERQEKVKAFGEKTQGFRQRIQEKSKQLRKLQQQMKTLKGSGDAAVAQNEKAYAKIVHVAEKRRSAVRELIRVQEEAALSQAQALVHHLESDISGLRRREDELKRLALTEDHIHFLQSFQCFLEEPQQETDVSIQLHSPFDFVTKVISDWRETIENVVKALGEMSKTTDADLDPKTRQEFSLYSRRLSLDPDTAFENLLLSDGNRKVTWSRRAQPYPRRAARFSKYDQVLCAEGLAGVCYWEVEWKGPRVEVAVCYERGDLEESSFGYTDQSWCLSLSRFGCAFWHDGVKTQISGPCSATVGVYLNHGAGRLAFYSVREADQMTLLHGVRATFSQPLYAGFMVSRGSSVRMVAPN